MHKHLWRNLQLPIAPPFSRWRNQDPEMLNKLPKVTELVIS